MNITNTPFNVEPIGPVNSDQVQACWRYLIKAEDNLSKWAQAFDVWGFVKDTKQPLTLLGVCEIACNAFNGLATEIHDGNRENLEAFKKGVNYENWHFNFPGFLTEGQRDYMLFKREYPNIFKKQLFWECGRWNLNPTVMKGCILGWCIEFRNMRDQIAVNRMKKFLRYSGPPHLLSGIGNVYITQPAMTVNVGGRKRRGKKRYY